MPPGPAIHSGQVHEGDILCEVNGTSVLRLPPSQVSPHLLGPNGTSVAMVFLRGGERVAVTLLRQPPTAYIRAPDPTPAAAGQHAPPHPGMHPRLASRADDSPSSPSGP